MINISLVSKYKDDRKTITALLTEQKDFHLISIGEDGYDALRAAKTRRPDIIIMDFNMGDIDSPDLAPIIKRSSPSTALIVLCSHEEQNTITRALKAGISGCLLRQEGFGNLVASVRSVFYGGLYINKSARDLALNCFSIPPEASPAGHISRPSFTPTELNIFYGITHGYTDREIAKNLNISTGSLRNCVNRIKKKTGLQNRTQIIIYALLDGEISIEKIR